MTATSAEALLTLLFGLCFAWMGQQMLTDLFPSGVGVFQEGWKLFAARVLILGLTFGAASVVFVHSLGFCGKIIGVSYVQNYVAVMVILVLSASPWACYHVVRIIMKPLAGSLYTWASPLGNVDALFLVFYLPVLLVLVVIAGALSGGK